MSEAARENLVKARLKKTSLKDNAQKARIKTKTDHSHRRARSSLREPRILAVKKTQEYILWHEMLLQAAETHFRVKAEG